MENVSTKCLFFFRKRTHEELFELAFVNVMREVANKKLVAVWVPDNSPAVHVTRFGISPATCRSKQQAEKHIKSAHINYLNQNPRSKIPGNK